MQVELGDNAATQTVPEPPDSQLESSELSGSDAVTFSTGLTFDAYDTQTPAQCPCEDTPTPDELDSPPTIESCPWYIDDMPEVLDLDEPYPSVNVVNIHLCNHFNDSAIPLPCDTSTLDFEHALPEPRASTRSVSATTTRVQHIQYPWMPRIQD